MTAADMIKKYRAENNFDQTEFANQMSVDQSTVSKWESGGAIDKDNCIKLAKTLGTPIMIFLTAGMKKQEETG